MSAAPAPALTRSVPSAGLLDAAGVLRRHASGPSSFLALNEGTSRLTLPGVDGFVAYRRAGRCLVQPGGVFAAPADQDRLLDEFLAQARRERRRGVAVELLRGDAEHYAARGFTVNQMGATYSRSLSHLSLKARSNMYLRNRISRGGELVWSCPRSAWTCPRPTRSRPSGTPSTGDGCGQRVGS